MNEVSHLAKRIKSGDRQALSKAITLAESSNKKDTPKLSELFSHLQSITHKSFRIAISGAPGVGKSSFIEKMGVHLCELGYSIAVLAVDPSSPKTGGSILGDKTRMDKLAAHASAFVRPSPSGENKGGIAQSTSDSVTLCEKAGFDIIFIETVGVGQSEFLVSDISDMFLLLLSPLGGDDLQGIKKGILEMVDMILINKSEGEHKYMAAKTESYLKSSINPSNDKVPTWVIPIRKISALHSQGIVETFGDMKKFWTLHLSNKNKNDESRAKIKKLIVENVRNLITDDFKNDKLLVDGLTRVSEQVETGEIPLKFAAEIMLRYYTSPKMRESDS